MLHFLCRSMMTRPRIDHVLIGAVLGMAVMLNACESGAKSKQKPQERRVVYHVVIRKVLEAPSARVIGAVKRAIDATRLEMVSSSTTNIDAMFHVQSALRKEFKIQIEAVAHHKTRIEISALDKADASLAQILFERINSNL